MMGVSVSYRPILVTVERRRVELPTSALRTENANLVVFVMPCSVSTYETVL